MNYAFTSNIREVIKSYNLGDKTFETDFKRQVSMFLLSHIGYGHTDMEWADCTQLFQLAYFKGMDIESLAYKNLFSSSKNIS